MLTSDLASELPRLIAVTGSLLTTQLRSELRLSVAAAAGSGRVAFSAVGDTCELCLALDGKVFDARSAEAARLSAPLHPNCDCVWLEVDDDEVGPTDAFTPEYEASIQDLIDQHAVFLNNPGRYEPLRQVARPDGRDFTFRRVKDQATGLLRSEIEFERVPYEIEGLDPATVITGVPGIGPGWRPLGDTPMMGDN